MKKISILVTLILFSFLSSQNYSFDFMTKYITKSYDGTRQTDFVTYFNTDDFSYYLKLYKTPNDFTATLFDYKNKKMHYFDVIETKSGKDINFNFKYSYSEKLSYDQNSFKKYRFVTDEISQDSLGIKVFKSSNSKKPTHQYFLSLKKANKNLFPLFRISNMHPYEGLSNFDLNQNAIVEKSIYECKVHKHTCEITLAEYKNVELDLNIPESNRIGRL